MNGSDRMITFPLTTQQLRSTLTPEGTMEISVAAETVNAPGPGQVLIEVGGAPINPTDLALLLGPADLTRASRELIDGRTVVKAPCHPGWEGRFGARIGHPIRVGIEGAGVVVAAGDGAEHLMGRTVAAKSGAMYAGHVVLDAAQCLVMPEGVSPRQAASSFVNPLTVLAMVETARTEGHKAIVHTAAASNLGTMLNRLCKADGIPLVNIVRRDDQAKLLRKEGAEHVCNSSSADFREQLIAAIEDTGATIVFDAIGGGALVGLILDAMENALKSKDGAYDMYGGDIYKQAYIYGALDPGETHFSRTFGMSWGICGWLLTPFLAKFGPALAEQMQARIAAEITTTFASHYTAELSLDEILQPEVLAAANRRATGEKYLVDPSKS